MKKQWLLIHKVKAQTLLINKYLWNFYLFSLLFLKLINKNLNWQLFFFYTLDINKIFFKKNKLTRLFDIHANNFILDYKTLYKFNNLNILKFPKPSKFITNTSNFPKKLIRYFYLYLILNKNVHINTFKVNHTFKSYYYYHSATGIFLVSLTKTIILWKKFYYLIYNLFYFKINTLFIGAAPYKYEIHSLNFNFNRYLLSKYRFVNLHFLVDKIEINTVNKFFFYRINESGVKSAIVFNLLHQMNSLYYLNKYYYYTIGPVPTSFSIDIVNFAVPILLNSLINQLFFLRLILLIKKTALKSDYSKKKLIWNTVKRFN